VGLPATAILYAILFLTGATITVSLNSIGGLLIFSLILNPAAAAYQLTYNMKKMFLLAAVFGVASGWAGLLLSYVFNLPSGATIVITSSLIFGVCALFSPKETEEKHRLNQLRRNDHMDKQEYWDSRFIAEGKSGEIHPASPRMTHYDYLTPTMFSLFSAGFRLRPQYQTVLHDRNGCHRY